jgi:hypothetical protein
MISTSRIVLCGVLFLLTLGSGVWVTTSGRPLNTAIFTIHKLIALALVILTGVTFYPVIRSIDPRALLVAMIALAGLLFLALFISGALLSFEKPTQLFILRIHQAAPLLALAALILSVTLLPDR